MPHGDPDPTDPLTLHGVVVETQDGQAMREMAECFVEEYIRLGFDPDRILQLFQTRGYAGPFLAYQTLGDEAIRSLIAEHLERRGRLQRGPGAPPPLEVGESMISARRDVPSRASSTPPCPKDMGHPPIEGERPSHRSETIDLTRGDS